jgi:anti-anti-sigma factor
VDPSFSVWREDREGCQVVFVAGELDDSTAFMLDEAVTACNPGWPVIVDLTEVKFMSSAGLHTVLRERAAAVSLVAPPGNITRLFEIVRANRHRPLYDHLDHALQTIASASSTLNAKAGA